MRNSIIRGLVVVLVACGVIVVEGSTAQAARPTISLAIAHPIINAGQRPVLTFSIAKAPKGSKFYVQRKMGSRGAWVSVARMSSRSGRVAAPAVGIGSYVYRVAVYVKPKHKKTQVTVSPIRGVLAYGNVSYRVFCLNLLSSERCTDSGTQTVNGRAFSYQSTMLANPEPQWNDYPSSGPTSCRSLSLGFAAGDTIIGSADGAAMQLRVLQQTRDARAAYAAPDRVGLLRVALDGRPLVLGAQSGGDGSSDQLLLSGVFNCYTANGKR